jgi:hypothetical protein
MTRILLAIALTLAFGTASAARTLEIVEDAYELGLPAVTFPSADGGFVRIQPCDECQSVALRVTSETQYFTNAGQLGRADFSIAVAAIRQTHENRALVVVFYDVESKEVTRIAVSAVGI